MKPFHISQAHQEVGLDGNLPFWIAMIQSSQKLLVPNHPKKVLDFGCGEGKFLPLFNLMDHLEEGLGVEKQEMLIQKAKEKNSNPSIDYKVYQENILNDYQNYFDVAYSQEVLYTIEDLAHHAKEIHNTLKKGGFYFATMGCHIDNPLWSKRRKIIRKEESYYAYDYSIEEVTENFHSQGFEVGLKRLPVEYFLIYDPKITPSFSNSLLDLVKTTYENKMLFVFWKPDER